MKNNNVNADANAKNLQNNQSKLQKQPKIRQYFSRNKRDNSAKILTKNNLNVNANPFGNIHIGPDEDNVEQLMQKFKMLRGKLKNPAALKYFFPQITKEKSRPQLGRMDSQIPTSRSRVRSPIYKNLEFKESHTIDYQGEHKKPIKKYKIRMHFSGDQIQKIRNQIQGQLQVVRKKRFYPFGASKARNLEIIRSKRQASLKQINFDPKGQKSSIHQIFSAKKKLNDYQFSDYSQLQTKIGSCTLQQSVFYG